MVRARFRYPHSSAAPDAARCVHGHPRRRREGGPIRLRASQAALPSNGDRCTLRDAHLVPARPTNHGVDHPLVNQPAHPICPPRSGRDLLCFCVPPFARLAARGIFDATPTTRHGCVEPLCLQRRRRRCADAGRRASGGRQTAPSEPAPLRPEPIVVSPRAPLSCAICSIPTSPAADL